MLLWKDVVRLITNGNVKEVRAMGPITTIIVGVNSTQTSIVAILACLSSDIVVERLRNVSRRAASTYARTIARTHARMIARTHEGTNTCLPGLDHPHVTRTRDRTLTNTRKRGPIYSIHPGHAHRPEPHVQLPGAGGCAIPERAYQETSGQGRVL